MIKLIEHGLFGNNLVAVNNEVMVKRYNACLQDIGLAPTGLTSFHIDGWGWSPEIAEEQGDRFYLSHGLANPYGIVLGPEQANCSIYMPYHSFDRQIHEIIFEQYKDQIDDITSRTGLWFEIDQEMSAYRSPQDLLMLDYVTLNFNSVGRIMKAAQKQRTMIRKFYDQPNAWANDELRADIIKSCKKYGDLRYMKLDIPDHPFNQVDIFHTLAFEGMFVIKNGSTDKPLLVFEGNNTTISGESKHGHLEYNLNDPKLMSYLFTTNMVTSDPEVYTDNPVLIDVLIEHLIVQAASEMDPGVEIELDNNGMRKKIIHQLVKNNLLPDAFFALERLQNQIQNGMKSPLIPASLNPYLLSPNKQLSKHQQIVLWQMLCKINPGNPLLTYLFDKSKFYSEYKSWNDSRRRWAANTIAQHRTIFNQLIQ
jgi:hypothetical protein